MTPVGFDEGRGTIMLKPSGGPHFEQISPRDITPGSRTLVIVDFVWVTRSTTQRETPARPILKLKIHLQHIIVIPAKMVTGIERGAVQKVGKFNLFADSDIEGGARRTQTRARGPTLTSARRRRKRGRCWRLQLTRSIPRGGPRGGPRCRLSVQPRSGGGLRQSRWRLSR